MEVQQEEFDKNSVERTLCIPLWCRALAVEKLPQILPDHDAARILREMGQTKPPTVFYRMECACLAGAIRQYDFAKEIEWYLREHPDAVVVDMATRFPGATFVFDTVSKQELKDGNGHVGNTDNDTRMTFCLDDAPRQLPAWSNRLVSTVQKSYLEGYPVPGVHYNLITRLYIRSKRDKLFMVHTEFRAEQL